MLEVDEAFTQVLSWRAGRLQVRLGQIALVGVLSWAAVGTLAAAQDYLTKDNFDLVFADKKTNSSGLQLSDLVARPIGRMILDPPGRSNRAWAIIEPKLFRPDAGLSYQGWGLKIFP